MSLYRYDMMITLLDEAFPRVLRGTPRRQLPLRRLCSAFEPMLRLVFLRLFFFFFRLCHLAR